MLTFRFLSTVCSLSVFVLGGVVAAADADRGTVNGPPPEVIARWRELKFGMFIHWGPVGLTGAELSWSRGDSVPIEVYDQLYKRFDPVKFNADEWVRLAEEAGMKYMIPITKHHDGFCMFDTKQTDYNIMHTPFGRDVLKELSDACRQRGMPFGTYYSVCDWHHPDFPSGSPGGNTKKPNADLDRYEVYMRNQVEELIRNYGPLLTMWFDVPQDMSNRGEQTNAFVRSLQPDILINNRSGARGDYGTPELRIGPMQKNRPWESCITLCRGWAWNPDDKMKSLDECLHMLVRVVCGDGNLLLNVGPMPDGRIHPDQAERLREMGRWLAKYGESIYGTRGGPFPRADWGGATWKDHVIYVHILDPKLDRVVLLPLEQKIVGHELLTGGTAAVQQTDDAIEISVPEADRQPIDTIVALRLDGPAGEPKLKREPPCSVALGKKAAASNIWRNAISQYGPQNAFDGDPETRWATDDGTKQAWLEVDLGKPATINCVQIQEEFGGRIQRFEIQVKNGEAWKTVAEGTTIGHDYRARFEPVTAQVVRLNILESLEGPVIPEFEIFAAEAP